MIDMKSPTIAFAALLLAGCSSTPVSKPAAPVTANTVNQQRNQYYQQCPYVMTGAKYIPEADTWIDYSEDQLSYHYHGRNRGPSQEEMAIYYAEKLLESSPDNPELQAAVAELHERFKDTLEKQHKEDDARFQNYVQETIAQAKMDQNNDKNRLSGK